MNFDSFVSDLIAGLIATVIGGALLTLLFFYAREKLFPLPTLSGRWYFESRTVITAYKPYAGMVLQYVAMVWQEGTLIHGTIEKTYENSSTGEREYVGINRTHGTLEGHVEKYYFAKDRVQIHIVETGRERSSTDFFDLVCVSSSEMTGSFQSMAADQSGTVKWSRVPLPKESTNKVAQA